MGKYIINISAKAEKDLIKIYKSGDKKSIKKLEIIFDQLQENPYEGIGNPEVLKHQYKGFWSRRINEKDRLIYEVREHIISVFVVSALGHYNDH
ncbi:Txe/YoeB family addiction module toxin [Pedobacter sp.]|uniref:Txe/YoeB family addiction module toxin n=1 Tax=Pedobacter sp. TaxID=1411316 RepID=UPI003D7FC288